MVWWIAWVHGRHPVSYCRALCTRCVFPRAFPPRSAVWGLFVVFSCCVWCLTIHYVCSLIFPWESASLAVFLRGGTLRGLPQRIISRIGLNDNKQPRTGNKRHLDNRGWKSQKNTVRGVSTPHCAMHSVHCPLAQSPTPSPRLRPSHGIETRGVGCHQLGLLGHRVFESRSLC